MASAPCVTFAPVDPLDLALDEARSRLERANGRRADLRATTARLYGFLGGVLAAGLVVLLTAGAAFSPWLAGAVGVGGGALLCIWRARPAAWTAPAIDLEKRSVTDFPRDLLTARIAAAEANRCSSWSSRWWMSRAEWLAAAAAVVIVVGAIVVVARTESRMARTPFGVPVAWEGGSAQYVLTPGARDGEELTALRNPEGGVPALVVGAAGRGATGCLPPYDPASTLRPGQALRGDALARAFGERRPEAPLQIAVCVPQQRRVEGMRAIELTWSGRALD